MRAECGGTTRRGSWATADAVNEHLLGRRTVVLGSGIDDEAATRIISQLLLLGSEDPRADIRLYLDSPGGSLPAGLAIHDAINFVPCDVSTWAVGQVGSVSSFILSSGARGKRFATATSLISLGYSPVLRWQADSDVDEHHLSEVTRLIAAQTGKPVEEIAHDLLSGPTLTSLEARDYGLVDAIAEAAPGGPQGN
jgi:ATP-dependent Clp protease, protease subunit